MNSETKSKPEPNSPNSFRSILDMLVSPSSALKDIGDQRSARLAASFLLAISVFSFIGGVARVPRVGISGAFTGGLAFSLLAVLVSYGLSRTKWYRASIFLFSLSFSATAYYTMLDQGNQADFGALILIYVPLSLIVASAFISSWAIVLLVLINIGAYLSLSIFGLNLPANLAAQAAIIGVNGAVLILLKNFRDKTEENRLAEIQDANRQLEILSIDLEDRIEIRTQELTLATKESVRRTKQLTAIAELARSITDVQDLDNLLPTITKFISQRMGYYHVGIFLSDEREIFAVLYAANSEGGQKMLERGHRLRIGKEGIVGYSVKTGQPRIALDVGADAAHFDNPDLPNTRSEMAIPLRLGPEYIGALDIQSTEVNAFSTEDMVVFTTLADQVAIAIQNARLLEQTQTALRETRDAYAQQTGESWKSFSKEQTVTGYHFDGIESNPITKDKSSKINFEANKIIPIRLRGTVIGSIKLKTTDIKRIWSVEEVGLIESAIERAAIALENAQLLEDAQRRATKERIISEGAARISAALDVESIMQATAEELEHALGGSEIIIQLESEE